MVQKLQSLGILLEDLNSILSTHKGTPESSVTIVSGDLTLFWPLWAVGTHMTHSHACRQTFTFKVIKEI